MEQVNTIHLQSGYVIAPLLFLICALFVAGKVFQKRQRLAKPQYKTDEPDWSIPTLDTHGSGNSFFHQWDPRIKILSLFLYCFLVVSLQTVPTAALSFAVSLLAIRVARLPWHSAVRRLLAMTGFLTMLLLILPFTAPQVAGETVIYFSPLERFPFHSSGFFLALLIIFKACAIALMMEPILATASFSVTLQGIAGLGVPVKVCSMILLSHRYIFVLLYEMKRMYRSMQVRGFRRRTDMNTLRTLGNFLGMLFVRSHDRTQRVYEAMLCRGFTGTFPITVSFNATSGDWLRAALWLVIGTILLIIDRVFI